MAVAKERYHIVMTLIMDMLVTQQLMTDDESLAGKRATTDHPGERPVCGETLFEKVEGLEKAEGQIFILDSRAATRQT